LDAGAANGAVAVEPGKVESERAGEQQIQSILLEVVSEKTGYPSEMLGLDMALDADLGIDSIKRVEILSALQERLPEAPAVRPEHLGTLHTLRHIADFLAGASPPGGAQDATLPTHQPHNGAGAPGLERL